MVIIFGGILIAQNTKILLEEQEDWVFLLKSQNMLDMHIF